MLARLHVIIRPRPGAPRSSSMSHCPGAEDRRCGAFVDRRTARDPGGEAGRGAGPRATRRATGSLSRGVQGGRVALDRRPFDVDHAEAVRPGRGSAHEPVPAAQAAQRPHPPQAVSQGFAPCRCRKSCRCWRTWGSGSSANGPTNCKFDDDERLWIQDFDMIPAVERELNLEIIRDLFQEAFEQALYGRPTATDSISW
jgi:hypothetical protein